MYNIDTFLTEMNAINCKLYAVDTYTVNGITYTSIVYEHDAGAITLEFNSEFAGHVLIKALGNDCPFSNNAMASYTVDVAGTPTSEYHFIVPCTNDVQFDAGLATISTHNT